MTYHLVSLSMSFRHLGPDMLETKWRLDVHSSRVDLCGAFSVLVATSSRHVTSDDSHRPYDRRWMPFQNRLNRMSGLTL